MRSANNVLMKAVAGIIVWVSVWNCPFIARTADLAPGKIEGHYLGTWSTTQPKELQGTLQCTVKQITDEQWEGRFWGTWEHLGFDYTVKFCGDPVTGTATIGDAELQWTGTLTQDEFKIQFQSVGCQGNVELVRVDDGNVL